jgi:hypothetical protein
MARKMRERHTFSVVFDRIFRRKCQGCLLQDIDFLMLQDFDSVAPFYCLAKRFVACWLCWQSLELMKNRDDKTAMVGKAVFRVGQDF